MTENSRVTIICKTIDAKTRATFVSLSKVELNTYRDNINAALPKNKITGDRYPEELEKRTGL